MGQITRLIIDECVGLESALVRRFQASVPLKGRVELVRLAERHRAIPDAEVLRQVLGPTTVLLTNDRVLHNQACDLGFRSYTMDQRGNLWGKKLPGVVAVKRVALPGRGELKSDYLHPANPIASALKVGITERAFKRYRTRRRRIRSYFGAESNIASAALTIGARTCPKGWICGFVLRLAGKSGVKGLQASEGYGLCAAAETKPTSCVIHALRELYLLQLETVPTELYIIPAASLALCQRVLEKNNGDKAAADIQAMACLLTGLAAVQIFPCVKGPFFDRMERKLAALGNGRSNELVTVGFDQITAALSPLVEVET